MKVLGHVNMPLDIATDVSFEDENEGDAVDTTVINDGHAKQEVADAVALPPTAKYSEIWTHFRPDFSR
ncbi:hypothetical protein MAM1_0068c04068 [Mucor ambiguus]|uniref:Uncharacterized protein n=1 Tax=Mucor ambiguus TaxID=91626 RepID=A0A0C9MN45_9FUNG|nr:hypothetical protein MAM1_0068c04068 [Mucor ambiguus]